MNILYIDLDDIRNPLLAGGQATATFEVGKKLIKRGHSVTVLCSKYPGYKDRIENGIQYRHIGINTSNIKINNLAFIFAAPLAVWSLDASKYDIVIESFIAPISTLCSPLFTSIPVIGLPSMFNAAEFDKKYHLPFSFFEKWGARCYRYFTPYSAIDSQKMLRLNPTINFRIIPQGVGDEFFSIKQVAPKHILFLGRYDIAQKGIDLLLQAYARVSDRLFLPLVIAGHGPDEGKIRRLITELQLSEKVKLLGPAYGEEKASLLANALFVALPSKHEEMSLWALEALAAGKPIVGFDLPEAAWLSDSVSLKAKPYSVVEYAQLLCEISEPTRYAKLQQACRPFAQQFTWGAVAEAFEQYFNEILSKEDV